jgi:hypothetical protein
VDATDFENTWPISVSGNAATATDASKLNGQAANYYATASALAAQKTDLASTASGKGASTVGVQDSAGNLTATTVEAALAEIYGLLLGVGQAWQNVTANRVGNTSYQNTTGKPIQVFIQGTEGGVTNAQVSSNGTTWVDMGGLYGYGKSSFIVPKGYYYRINATPFNLWTELR